MVDELFKTITIVASSPLRRAIIKELKRKPMGFVVLRDTLCKELGVKVTDGRLAWHLKVLESKDAITETGVAQESRYTLTKIGAAAYEATQRAYQAVDKAGGAASGE